METNVSEITINGLAYVPKESANKKAEDWNGMDYVIVRTYSAGVFAGYIESKNGQEVVLRNVRRLWYWSGAASLSQLALEGVKNPTDCKFTVAVDKITLLQAIEIIDATEKAQKNIAEVGIWKM